jgi:ATPase subunit of ABC transporter with duplicated ATPase domains
MLQNTSIKFPPNKQNIESVETSGSIVIVGANGAGKTRLSIRMLELNPEKEHCRIAAQKKLEIQDNLHFYDLEKSTNRLYYGFDHISATKPSYDQIQANKWRNKPATTMQNDFEHLLTVLISDHANISMKDRKSFKNGSVSSPKDITS